MPELTGISCSTCGQAFANKRALAVHSRYCGCDTISHNVRDVLRHGRDNSSSSLRKTKIARTSRDSVSAHDTAGHDNDQDELSVQTTETSQSSDFDYENLGEDTPSDAESLSGVLDGLDSEISCEDPNRTASINQNVRYIPIHTRFQVKLEQIRNKHRADQKLFNEITDLIKEFSTGSELSFSSTDLLNRKRFLIGLEATFKTEKLRPEYVSVKLLDGTVGTVSVFDLEEQIVSLLTDPNLMQKKNLAPGLDIFTGLETTCSDEYGEIHTGKAWARAVAHHIAKGSGDMPVGLIIYGNKSHFDTHGSLCVTPLSFTLSIFSREARNTKKFWRPMAYLPNLDQDVLDENDDNEVSVDVGPTTSEDSLEDEQKCLAIALKSLKAVHRKGGFATTVLGRKVKVRVWIHFICGDTHGNNRWVAHFNSPGKLAMPWRNCKCPYLT